MNYFKILQACRQSPCVHIYSTEIYKLASDPLLVLMPPTLHPWHRLCSSCSWAGSLQGPPVLQSGQPDPLTWSVGNSVMYSSSWLILIWPTFSTLCVWTTATAYLAWWPMHSPSAGCGNATGAAHHPSTVCPAPACTWCFPSGMTVQPVVPGDEAPLTAFGGPKLFTITPRLLDH